MSIKDRLLSQEETGLQSNAIRNTNTLPGRTHDLNELKENELFYSWR